MLLNNSNNHLPEDCRKIDTRTFVLYAKAQLNREQERFVDNHCGRCDNCRANLAYVFEIVKGNEHLSTDGQTLLLKYLHDPIYKDAIEKLKDSIREEILDEIRFLLVDVVKDNKAFSLTNAKDCPSITDKNPTNNQNSLDKVTSQTSSQTSKTFNKIINKIPNIKANYSYFVSVFLVVVFTSLSIFTYLTITSKPNQQSNNTNNSFNNSSSLNPIFSTITQPRPNDQLSNNLYQQLDTAIDEYLESKNTDDLNKAKIIAKDIEQKYGDNYGVDLVGYYQSIPSSVREKLQTCRKQMFSLLNQANGDNYKQRLEDSLALSNSLFVLGNLPETYRIKFLIAKLYAKTYKYQECNIVIGEGITFSEKNHYLILQGYFLLWKAKNTSLTGNFLDTEQTFKSVINIGQKIGVSELIINPAMTLTGLYQMRDEDQKALETAQSVLANSNQPDINIELIIGLKQMAGLAAFKLGFFDLANSYLHDAIELSEKSKNPYLIASSYTFLGLTLAETKNFVQSQEAYSKAQTAVSQIQEEDTRLDALSIVLGYQAKAKLSEGDFQEATNLYRKTLDINNRLGDKNNIENSQLNEGLAIALEKIQLNKESQEHFALASHYKTLATSKHELSNCLLSYLPSACYLGK